MKRFIGAAAVAGIAIFGGASALEDNTTRNDAGEIVEGGGLGAFAVQIGDCVQLPSEDIVVSLEAVPCAEPHDAQAYAKPLVGFEGEYDEDAVLEAAQTNCLAEFEGFTGEAYDDSPYYINYLFPTKESWEREDDREILCMITGDVGEKLTSDLR